MLCDIQVDSRHKASILLYYLEADVNTGAKEHPLMAEKIRQTIRLVRSERHYGLTF